MNKEKIDLSKGFIEIYDFGGVKLHAYQTNDLMNNADCILIGAGSGLSTASGIDYAGDEFKKEFAPFIKKYII